MRAVRLATFRPPSRPQSTPSRATTTSSQGLIPEAEQEFQTAHRRRRPSAAAHAGLAQVRERSGNSAEARAEAQSSIKLQPNVAGLSRSRPPRSAGQRDWPHQRPTSARHSSSSRKTPRRKACVRPSRHADRACHETPSRDSPSYCSWRSACALPAPLSAASRTPPASSSNSPSTTPSSPSPRTTCSAVCSEAARSHAQPYSSPWARPAACSTPPA